MLTFAEMKEAFETYIGASDQVDNAQLALWFNEAQLDLAYDLGAVTTLELNLAAGDQLSPEQDWLRLVDCDLEYRRQADGRLVFPRGGQGRLYLRLMPTAFTGANNSQLSPLHPALHYLPPIFAASRYWDAESEGDGAENAQAAKWLSYYYQGKNLARSRLHQAGVELDRWQVG